MNFELREKLGRVAGRIRSLRFWSGLAVCWLAWAAVGAVLWAMGGAWGIAPATTWPMLAALAAISAAVWGIAVMGTGRDDRLIARRVEARHPELGALLLTAVEQAALRRERGKGPTFLQASVIRQALEHGRSHNWSDTVSVWRLRAAKLAQFATLAALVGVCVALANRGGALARSDSGLLPNVATAGGEFEVAVDPGNAEIERGTSLLVVASFAGAVPPDATLIVEPKLPVVNAEDASAGDQAADAQATGDQPAGSAESDANDKRQSIAMVRSLDDPKFVSRVASVGGDLTYRVEFAGGKSETYRITVFDYPELVRADAKLSFPEYTSLAPTVIEDVRQITAVEGTRLELVCRLNKEVRDARLVDGKDRATELKQDLAEKNVYRAGWTLRESQRFKLHLTDGDGRKSRLPAEIVVNVTPNRPPKIAIDRPGRDVDVSPLEELELAATVSDEFGVARYGVSYALGGDEFQDVEFPAEEKAASAAAAKQRNLSYLLDFEAYGAEPDQLLSYYVWAEDHGPDGELRRTYSDMYFAAVRPFEEIFRQGQQPSESEMRQQRQQQQGQGGAAEAAGELADLQKEIINATWKLIRRETGGEPTGEFAADAELVRESQESALERLAEIEQQVEDPESRGHVETIRTHMTSALNELTMASDGQAIKPLRPALSAEQGAYQALLKLRARESQVIRGQQQGGGGGGGGRGNRSQQQLNELELSADENRYETQRRATAPQQDQAQRESREILNRLRDLARRQEDLNERLRELQSALTEARTPERREELERELKRLRDQQREILRDTDEVAGRMEQAEDQQASQTAREQMEEGRSRIQQASEALDEGQLSQAITEGTRAGRQLSEVRDEFRRQSANQFADEMTELRREARQLDERQQQISEQLTERNRDAGRSLRDSGGRAEAQANLNEQRQRLEQILERMQETVQEAEEPEPLLARQLYDTIRRTHHERVEDALDVAQQLLDVGIEREAGEAMEQANQGVRNLRQGVERAAESVLGDEAEALRRAQQEVNRLAEELNREIEQASGKEPGGEQAGEGDERTADGAGENQNNPRRGQGNGSSDKQRQQGESGEQRGRGGQSEEREQNPSGEDGGQQGAQGERGQGERGQGDANEGQGEGSNEGQGQGQGESARQGEGGGQGGNGEPRDGGRGNADGESRERQSLRGGGANRGGGIERFLNTEGPGGGPAGGPITGDDFRGWSDRIGDVEEMLDDPQLRSDAARIRDRAADARADYKRHSKVPDWKKLQELVADPLNELSRRIGEEIRRRESPDSLVPIDRDQVPPEYSEQVRRYYERVGSGE